MHAYHTGDDAPFWDAHTIWPNNEISRAVNIPEELMKQLRLPPYNVRLEQESSREEE